MSSTSSFSGAKAVITGSSSGIGQATAVALARSGAAALMVHYRVNERGALATATMARDAGCQQVFVSQADLQVKSQRDALVEDAFGKLGTIDAWVNNAGADVLTGNAATLDFDAKLQRLWHVDVAATIDLARQVTTRWLQQESETIPSMTFIGWDQAPAGMEGEAGQLFGPTKAAIMAFAGSLAQEVSPAIRVNTVAPGWIRTSWGESTSDYWDQRANSQSLMQRWGKPDDVARAILYAADPANTFLCGQTIQVNGGWNRKF
jgi:3-oxoacyl-[acyl-carrier protein] reductase